METTRRSRRVSWPVMAVVAVTLAYAWIASGLRPFTHPERVAVSIPLVITGIAILRPRRRHDRLDAGDEDETVGRRGTWVWVVLLVVLLAWELISYRLSPRVDHPTLSSIADAFMRTHVSRFVTFVAWLVAGYWLFRR